MRRERPLSSRSSYLRDIFHRSAGEFGDLAVKSFKAGNVHKAAMYAREAWYRALRAEEEKVCTR